MIDRYETVLKEMYPSILGIKFDYIDNTKTSIKNLETVPFIKIDFELLENNLQLFDKKNFDTKYQRDRKAEYDKLNQDELRYNDLVNGTNTWIEAIQNIKLKFPKPE